MLKNKRAKGGHLSLVKEKPWYQGLWRFTGKLVTYALLLAGLGFLAMQGEAFFRVDEIIFSGIEPGEAEVVAAAGGLVKGKSIFLVREKKAAASIMLKHPVLKNVTVTRHLPRTIIIEAGRREAVALVPAAGPAVQLDREGILFVGPPRQGLPRLVGLDRGELELGAPLPCLERLELFKAYQAVWEDFDLLTIERLDFSAPHNLVLQTAEGPRLWLGQAQDMERKRLLVEEAYPYLTGAGEALLDLRCGHRLIVAAAEKELQEGVEETQ